MSSWVVGVFIDIDHWFDYFANEGVKFDLHDFFHKCEETKFKKVYIVLHSVELLIPLGVMLYFTNYSLLVIGIIIGFLQHLIFDQMFNHGYWYTYFFLVRWRKQFVTYKLFSLPT